MINPPEMHRAERRLTGPELEELGHLLRIAYAPVDCRLGMCLDVYFAPDRGQSVASLFDEISEHVERRLGDSLGDDSRVAVMDLPDIGQFMPASDRDAYMVRFCEVL